MSLIKQHAEEQDHILAEDVSKQYYNVNYLD